LTILADAHIFYYLEAWVANPAEPYTTTYLSQLQSFQRHITTTMFKLAGGIDLITSATGRVEQHPVAPAFIQKIVRAFLDSLYAVLDGLVHLASEESPIATGKKPVIANAGVVSSTNRLELLNLADLVITSASF
jgi:exocyst complex component 2